MGVPRDDHRNDASVRPESIPNFSLSWTLLLTALPAMSQTGAGLSGFTGLVIDTSGAAVPHSEVVVDNARLGIHRALTTTDSGVFNVPALVPQLRLLLHRQRAWLRPVPQFQHHYAGWPE